MRTGTAKKMDMVAEVGAHRGCRSFNDGVGEVRTSMDSDFEGDLGMTAMSGRFAMARWIGWWRQFGLGVAAVAENLAGVPRAEQSSRVYDGAA